MLLTKFDVVVNSIVILNILVHSAPMIMLNSVILDKLLQRVKHQVI